ncbi:MAG: hemN [Rickettsiaceae bacterium]|jgi:oxygen-independent coproporphyrinogen-3 oxidase|nr:hemN [Rickettsiaceae bacterium]
MKQSEKPLSIYIHYPFCKSKCPYCDFNSHIFKQIDEQNFLQAYLNELRYFAPQLKQRKINTIFFGGGTPSLMPAYFVEKLLEEIAKLWSLDENCEVTLEANPTSFEATKFKDFKRCGINRLSIGIQALNDSDLKFLGREHSAAEAINTIKTAGEIFDNYSFDLIYARPNQNLKDWEIELQTAISLSANHLSLYQLTIEKGTKFYGQYLNKEFALPDENLSADLYETTNEICTKNNLQLYEISNYARPGFECKHNLAYWKSDDYLGIGAGAHSRIYLDGEKERSAIMMLHQPSTWLEAATTKGAAIQQMEKINEEELLEEVILMGLRLKEGIDNQIFQKHCSKNIDEIFDLKKLEILVQNNLVEIANNNIKIPYQSLILANSIIRKIIEAISN